MWPVGCWRAVGGFVDALSESVSAVAVVCVATGFRTA